MTDKSCKGRVPTGYKVEKSTDTYKYEQDVSVSTGADNTNYKITTRERATLLDEYVIHTCTAGTGPDTQHFAIKT